MIKHLIHRLACWLHIRRRMFIVPQEGKEHAVRISYAITVCNEAEQLKSLLEFLQPYVQAGDEIVVQADQANVSDAVREVAKAHPGARYAEHELRFDFAQTKNHLNGQCHGDWIFQLDADERPSSFLMSHLKSILCANTDCELIKLPRLNMFVREGKEVEESHVAWPDYQGRLYRNIPQRIQWHRPLHEKIQGYKAYTYLPKDDRYAILHIKDKEQDRQKWQTWKEHYR